MVLAATSGDTKLLEALHGTAGKHLLEDSRGRDTVDSCNEDWTHCTLHQTLQYAKTVGTRDLDADSVKITGSIHQTYSWNSQLKAK